VRFIKNHVFRAAGLGIAIAVSASLALASQGNFTLPMVAHLGNATLNPGDYQIITPEAVGGVNVVYFYGNGKLRATLPLGIRTELEPGRSYLELVNVGGTYFVRTYNAGIAGRAFTFDIPKKVRHEAVANVRATSLPVHTGEGN
jgi:hypothetical protein